MKKYISVSFTVFLSFLLAGCNSIETQDSLYVDSIINFRFYESYTGDMNRVGEPKIFLELYTEKIYPYPYILEVNQNIFGRDININIVKINIPESGPDVTAPASAYLLLSLPDGTYNLNIRVKGNFDNYVINITTSEITVKIKKNTISNPIYKKYFRYPKNSFAYYCGTLNEYKYICEDFSDTLKSKINIEEFYFPKDGQKPYPDSTGGYYFEMPAKYFIYKTEEEYDKIEDILRDYQKTVLKDKEGTHIRTISWRNKNFYSWLL